MKIYNYRYGDGCRFCGEEYAESGCVLALGFFDGVHIAHRALIARAKECASELGARLGVFTFPSKGSVKSGAPRIYGDGEKLGIFESLGVDFTVLADFSSLSSLSAEKFVSDVLISDLGAAVCAAGFNFRFGKGASGNSATLSALMAENGARAVIEDELSDGGQTVSASRIRTLLSDGEISEAARLLGEPYSLTGEVERGNSMGKRLGYPTVNIRIGSGRALPRRGVYKSSVEVDGKIHKGLTNLGTCPTLGEREVHAETYILGFSGDLYGKRVRVRLLEFLRDERRFNSPDELKMQINVDINTIKEGNL